MNTKLKLGMLDSLRGDISGWRLANKIETFIEIQNLPSNTKFSSNKIQNKKINWQDMTPRFLRDQHIFTWQSREILSIFNLLTSKQVLWKNKNLFQIEYLFLVESNMIENVPFPYKTVLLKEKKTTSRHTEPAVQNGPIRKNRV